MLKNITFLAVTLCLSAPVFAYDTLEDLMTDIGRKQVDALKVYIADHPDADDIAEAEQQLIYGLVSQDDYAGALTVLEKKYEALPEDKSDLDLSMAFGEVVVPIIQIYNMDGRKDDGLAFIAKVSEDFKNHEMKSTIDEALDEFTALFNKPGVGDAAEVSFEAIDGTKVDLADMKGKVVLIDFWATWCAPCVRAMPEVVSLYNDYHDKGFEVIGISLDSERERLDAFIKENKMPWPQYFDGEGWDNKIASTFGISAIPATYLVGPDGMIVANDASADELRAKIEELLPKTKE